MRRWRSGLLWALSLAGFAVGWAWGQQTAPSMAASGLAPALAQRSDAAPVAGTGHIQFDVVVTDTSGNPVSGLERKDFSLLDNNQPSPILSFNAVDGTIAKSDPPVEGILLIDTVNLDFQAVSFVRQEIARFLSQNGGHLAQPVSIYLLGDQNLSRIARPSTDGNALAAALNQADSSLRTITRSQGAYGAIDRLKISLQGISVIAETEARKPGRKLVIWAGPGWPMLDNVHFDSTPQQQRGNFDLIVGLSAELRAARISVYSISAGQTNIQTFLYRDFLKGVRSPEQANPPNMALKVLAVQSGGQVVGPDNDLAAQIGRCLADAASYYTISFDPPRADRGNEYHELKVQIDRPGMTARTRTGYYSQP